MYPMNRTNTDLSSVNEDATTSEMSSNRKPSLAVGERVVWLDSRRQDKAEFATVRWVGRLPNEGSEILAGVQFDNPIGGGTGRFRGREIFKSPLNHASFVPLCGLMRSEDFVPPSEGEKQNVSIGSDSSQMQTIHPKPEYTLGSCVEIDVGYDGPCFGVIKWIGDERPDGNQMIGLEMEHAPILDANVMTDGSYEGRQYFSCPPGRGLFVFASQVKADHRFTSPVLSFEGFGSFDSGVVTEYTVPQVKPQTTDICGSPKGIQGHRNSCYLDATLYAMFAHSTTFDNLLLRPKNSKDIENYEKVVRTLAHEIVYPLRRKHYVRADHVIKFRSMLSELLPEIQGLTDDEKDPEELLNGLLSKLLKAKHYIKLKHGDKIEKSYLCQLICEEPKNIAKGRLLPSVQFLLERSFFESEVRFDEVPRILIIQLPRYGTERVYDNIVPSSTIDVTHLITNGPKPCCECKNLAELICPECYLTTVDYIAQSTFCFDCFNSKHKSRNDMAEHCANKLPISREAKYAVKRRNLPIPIHKLELQSVLCIETSHYVSFNRTTGPPEARWVQYDSMANRQGYANGYNIPEVVPCPQLDSYLTNEGMEQLRAIFLTGRLDALSRNVLRLLKDCYICMYVSDEASIYC